MAERAQVTSVEAIKAFRSGLIVYLSKARPALEEVHADTLRARAWLETDRTAHWERELARRRRIWEEAEQVLFGAKMSTLSDYTTSQQLAVRRAKQSMDEAEVKLRIVKKWAREFGNRWNRWPNNWANSRRCWAWTCPTPSPIWGRRSTRSTPTPGWEPQRRATAPAARRSGGGNRRAGEGEAMSATGSRLSGLTKELIVQWRETQEHWQDAKAVEFERKYLEELRSSVDAAVTVIEQVDILLAKIRKDCE